ncbi:MAG: cadherin-like beta sandwich domain-containing protein, partial [Lachnospiraceae bacterium]|nr:cadherin-like beta sandwich domain-containing protein [Lachnospiraceae bacterium]
MTPEFDPEETDYIVTTPNATNKVTATPESADATVVITVNDTEIESGDIVTWDSGDNEVVVKVTGDDGTTTYSSGERVERCRDLGKRIIEECEHTGKCTDNEDGSTHKVSCTYCLTSGNEA